MKELQLSIRAARALLLAAQGLHHRPRRRAGKADVQAVVQRMGALQIDTIHVVARSPYLVLWSRLGSYDPGWLDALLAEGLLFEYWAHEACFLPIEAYPLFRHRMLRPRELGWKYRHEWMQQHRGVTRRLLAHIRDHGPVRSADFARTDGRKGGGWWGWKTEKRALEYLFSAGELMIARRERFQRVYDLRERVLPDWDDAYLPPAAEARRALALDAVRALGVARAPWVADYYRMPRGPTTALVHRLGEAGALRRVVVAGWKDEAYVHPDHLELAERAASGRLQPRLTTLLSPFDPVIWDRARARELFDFDYALECYTPAPKRRYGYYVLPILRRGALVGRLDAKAHRRAGSFEVRVLYLEPGVRPSRALAADVADTLSRCAAWHDTPEVIIRRTEPAAFRALLYAALPADAPS